MNAKHSSAYEKSLLFNLYYFIGQNHPIYGVFGPVMCLEPEVAQYVRIACL